MTNDDWSAMKVEEEAKNRKIEHGLLEDYLPGLDALIRDKIKQAGLEGDVEKLSADMKDAILKRLRDERV